MLAATYVMPLESTGHSVALYAVDTNSDVSTIGTLSVLGAGRIYGARYIIPLPSIESRYYHSFIVGADYKDFDESIRVDRRDRRHARSSTSTGPRSTTRRCAPATRARHSA